MGTLGYLTKLEVLQVPNIHNSLGIEKLTLTVGEPLLFPHLGELLKVSKKMNLTTMIVSNGSLITKEFLQKYHKYINWIGLSLDSAIEQTEYKLGRGFGSHVQKIKDASRLIKEFSFLKI